MNKIPFVDLYAQYTGIREEIDGAITRVIQNTSFIGGNEVKSFEHAFSDYLQVKHCISCANGTDSLEILLKAYGIGAGDEVIVPAISWISTSEAVSSVGARPVFVDIHPQHYTMDESKIEAVVSPKSKAIIPVHLYGHPCNMDVIMAIAAKYGLTVIEDCAQSHGSRWNGQITGSIGHAASFSFYPGKNLGAYGDAGAMATNDDTIAAICRRIANHGQEGKHNHVSEGRNSRLDGMQAAILSAKLPHLSRWTGQRQAAANAYRSKLSGSHLQLPQTAPQAEHVFHLFVVRSSKRDALMQALSAAGIETAIHYPSALPFLVCYQSYRHKAEDFPVAFQYQKEILSLPMYPELEENQMEYIASVIRKFESEHAG